MADKIKIERNTVQETLVVPLYGRKLCAEKFPDFYFDSLSGRLCQKLDYDFSALEAKKNSFFYEFGALEAAIRQMDMMVEIKAYLKEYPNATVVNLGCGLDQTAKACDNGLCRIVNLDLPDIIRIRNQLLVPTDREMNIAADLLDFTWMQKIDSAQGVIFFAAGVFHYFKRQNVKALVREMAKRFPQGRLVFDTVGKTGLRLMLSQSLRQMGIGGVNGYFYVNHPGGDFIWSERIKARYKPYMLGYFDMKSRGIDWRHRFLAGIGDRFFKMAIIRLDFKDPERVF